MSDRVDISGSIRCLCHALGLRPKDVLELDIHPDRVDAVLLRRRTPDGPAYRDEQTGDVAVEIRSVPVEVRS